MNIKIKIAAILTICLVLLALVLGWVSTDAATTALTGQAKRELSLKTEEIAYKMQLENRRLETAVESLSVVTATLIDLPKAKASSNDYFASYIPTLDIYTRDIGAATEGSKGSFIYFKPELFSVARYSWYGLEEGVFVHLADESADVQDKNYLRLDDAEQAANTDFSWYYDAINADKGVWTDIYFDEDLKFNCISYVMPLKKEGETIGIVGMDMNFQKLERAVRDAKIFDTGFAFLIDSNGEFIVEPRESTTVITEAERAEGMAALTETSGILDIGDDYWSYQKLENGQTIVVVASRSEVLSSVSALKSELFFITIIVTIVMVALGILLMSSISRRISALKQAADKITNGDFDVQLPATKAKDEVAALTASMEMLVAAFKARAQAPPTTKPAEKAPKETKKK